MGNSDKARGELQEKYNLTSESVDVLSESMRRGAEATIDYEEKMAGVSGVADEFDESVNNAKGKTLEFTDHIVNSAEAMMSLVGIFNMIKGAVDALTDPDLSGWEKFTSVMMSLASIIPMVTTLLKNETVA
jgi:hypothetical protein